MKNFVFLALLVCSFGAFAQSVTPVGAWMPVNAKWHKAPAEIEPALSTASTRILFFQLDGKMSEIGCVVHRRFGRYAISAGDGQTIAVGNFHEEHGRIVARSRLVYRPVEKIGEALPGPWVDEVFVPKDGKLLLKGVLYGRVPDLDKGAAELMPQVGPP